MCAAVAALLAVGPGGATAATGTAWTAPTLTQTFLPFSDFSWYAIAPGEKYDSFAGTGWVLTGGAKIVTTTLYDGTKGYVLDLPSRATATSPPMWVTSDYPTARTMVRNVIGSAGVNVSVAYLGITPGPTQSTGNVSAGGVAWSLSRVVQIHPGNLLGWQQAQFTLVGIAGE